MQDAPHCSSGEILHILRRNQLSFFHAHFVRKFKKESYSAVGYDSSWWGRTRSAHIKKNKNAPPVVCALVYGGACGDFYNKQEMFGFTLVSRHN